MHIVDVYKKVIDGKTGDEYRMGLQIHATQTFLDSLVNSIHKGHTNNALFMANALENSSRLVHKAVEQHDAQS